MTASYFSIIYLAAFLPAVMLCYNLVPQKHRPKVLLGASYLFFFLISKKLIIYLILSTVSVYYFGLWMAKILVQKKAALAAAEKAEKKAIKAAYQRRLRHIVTAAVVLHIGVLVVLKYTAFFSTNLNVLLESLDAAFRLPVPKFMLPIGISFYTLQAASYLFDVYRGVVQADRNFGRVALFMSFFPQIIEGPICRYGQTAQSLWDCRKITYRSMTFGMQRILFGLMKKKIIADRLNMFIVAVFDEYAKFDGGVIFVAMLCYTFQLYMDFSGTLDVVIGSGEIFGVKLPENFRQPFFSKTISEFWSRWHITLGTWFKDYIFYPMSTSKPLKHLTMWGRKRLGNHFGPLLAGSIALFTVWICNGLWHGDDWKYIFFGLFHFALILTGNIVDPFAKSLCGRLHINRQSVPYKGMQILRTVLLVNVGELFFRATDLTAGLAMFRKMVTDFSFRSIADGTILTLGMDRADFVITVLFAVGLIAVGILREKGVPLRERVAAKPIALRWAVYYAMIMAIVIFGAYGVGYIPVDPIYANF